MSGTSGTVGRRQRHRRADLRGPAACAGRLASTSSATAPRSSTRRAAGDRRVQHRLGAAQGRGRQRRQRRPTSPPAPRPPAPPTGRRRRRHRRRRARPAAHPRHPGHELARRRTTASRSPTCRASSPAIRTDRQQPRLLDPGPRARTRTRPPARASSSSPRRPAVAVGDSVLGLGHGPRLLPAARAATPSATTSNLSVTEIGTPTVIVRSHGNPLPAPEVHRPRHGARRLRPGPRRRATSSRRRSRRAARRSTSGSRARACGSRSTTPAWSARPTASASSTSPPSRTQAATYRGGTELLAENAIPSGRVEVVPAERLQPRRRRRRRLRRRHGRARSTTRSSAAT